MEEHYAVDDLILPILSLASPCEIRIDVTEDSVNLQIGQRDWQWKRGCPDIVGCGTFLGGEGIPFDPVNLPTQIPDEKL